jgi:hypothetical protein
MQSTMPTAIEFGKIVGFDYPALVVFDRRATTGREMRRIRAH